MKRQTKDKDRRTKAAQKETVKREIKVWRIFRFEQRFELKDKDRHCRKTGLLFTRDFVSDSGGDEAIGYQQQFDLLANSNGLDYSLFYGVYRQLVNMAARHSRAFRGYLLNADKQPLTDSQIAKLLRFETKRMVKILKRFASVRLLEKVNIPEFDLAENEQPSDDNQPVDDIKNKSDTKSSDSSENTKRGSDAHKCGFGASSVRDGCGSSAEQLRCRFKKKNGNGKKQREKKRQKTAEKEKTTACAVSKEKIQTEQPKAQSPPTTQPIKPKEADPGGSVSRFTGPLGSDTRLIEGSSSRIGERSEPQQLGNIARGILHRYNPEAKIFSDDVFEALQLSCHPLSQQGKREAASFAALWQMACHSGLSPSTLAELRERTIVEARRIVKYWHGRKGKPAAVFCTIFNKMLTNKKQKMM